MSGTGTKLQSAGVTVWMGLPWRGSKSATASWEREGGGGPCQLLPLLTPAQVASPGGRSRVGWARSGCGGVRWPGLRVRGRLWGHPGTGAVPTDPSLVPPPPNPINGQICVMEQTGSHRTYISSLLWPCRDDILQNSRPWRAARRGGSVRNVLQTPPSCGATGELRSGPQS